MKPTAIFLICATILFIAGTGFAPENDAPFEITDCALKVDQALLIIEPTNKKFHVPANFRISILQNDKEVALGFTRLELLKLPEKSFSISIPLSTELAQGKEYSIKIQAQAGNKISFNKDFATRKARGTSSGSFFRRAFQPIPELAQIRESIICVRSEIGIN
jgi:hypothetical protein